MTTNHPAKDVFPTSTNVAKSDVITLFEQYVIVRLGSVGALNAMTTDAAKLFFITDKIWAVDLADTTSADNGTTVLVSADGYRYKPVSLSITFAQLSSQAAGLAVAPFGPFTAIPSAATTDLSTVATIGAGISGTADISSFGTGANLLRICKATGTPKLIHNATSLILPGGEDIQTVAGDTWLTLSDASGYWTVLQYQYASLSNPLVPVASAIFASQFLI